MPWQSSTTAETREAFICSALQNTGSFSALCREYGIARKTGYKWLHRYEEDGNLCDRTRRPKSSPGRTPPEMERRVLEERTAHPVWGPRKLHAHLRALGLSGVPAPSTIEAILRRNERPPDPYAVLTVFSRFEHEHPNALWQADFKKYFVLDDGAFCLPLTVLDDHSRFCLCLEGKHGYEKEGVFESFTRLFREYGLPDALLCDNGRPWRTGRRTLSEWEVWLMRLGVLHIHGRPQHPETQGKIERFHRSFREEVLAVSRLPDFPAAQSIFDGWRGEYNSIRPHEALSYEAPVSRYRASPRAFPEVLPAPETPGAFPVRVVDGRGYFRYMGATFFAGNALSGLTVSILPHPENPTLLQVLFNGFFVYNLSIAEGKLMQRAFARG